MAAENLNESFSITGIELLALVMNVLGRSPNSMELERLAIVLKRLEAASQKANEQQLGMADLKKMLQAIDAKISRPQFDLTIEWLSVAKFAELIDKSAWTARQYCLKGMVRCRKIGTGLKEWRVHKDEVKRVLEEGAKVQVQPPHDPNDN